MWIEKHDERLHELLSHGIGSGMSGEEARALLRFLERIREATRMDEGDLGGLFGLNANETSSSFTATRPESRKRQHMPLNCSLVPGEGTGVVHHFGFSAE